MTSDTDLQAPISTDIRPLQSRYNLRSRPDKIFQVYERFEHAFDTEPDSVQTAFTVATSDVKNQTHESLRAQRSKNE